MSWREVLIALGAVVGALVVYDLFLKKRISRLKKSLKGPPKVHLRTVQTFHGQEPHRSRRVPRWVVKASKEAKNWEFNEQDQSNTLHLQGKHFVYEITIFEGPEQGHHWGKVQRARRRK